MEERRRGLGRPVVVALDGRSGSGKSTLAVAVAGASGAVVIPVDDFFAAAVPDAFWDGASPEERWRAVFDWTRLRAEAIEPLLAGDVAAWHAFDFESGRRPDGTYGMRGDWTVREPAPVIILDGAYTAGPQLADLVDLSVLVEAPASEVRARLEAREAADFLAAWHARWDPVETYYFTHVRPRAAFDLVVTWSDDARASRKRGAAVAS
jgi:para-aminobenzoate synthetase